MHITYLYLYYFHRPGKTQSHVVFDFCQTTHHRCLSRKDNDSKKKKKNHRDRSDGHKHDSATQSRHGASHRFSSLDFFAVSPKGIRPVPNSNSHSSTRAPAVLFRYHRGENSLAHPQSHTPRRYPFVPPSPPSNPVLRTGRKVRTKSSICGAVWRKRAI